MPLNPESNLISNNSRFNRNLPIQQRTRRRITPQRFTPQPIPPVQIKPQNYPIKLKFQNLKKKYNKKRKLIRKGGIKLIDFQKLKQDRKINNILKFFNTTGKLKTQKNIYTDVFSHSYLKPENTFVFIKTSSVPQLYNFASISKYLRGANNGRQLDPYRSIKNGDHKFSFQDLIKVPNSMKKEILKILRRKSRNFHSK